MFSTFPDTVLRAGIHIVPFMSPSDVVTIACEAERIGYDYCLIADEGFQADVFSSLAVIASKTSHIELGPVTNGYTRHPAVIASALATLDSLSDGRSFVTILAGGSMVLEPMGIERDKPFRVVKDTIEVLQGLWTGDEVTWTGHRNRLDRARLDPSVKPVRERLPIWVASRGPMILRLAGRTADAALLTVKPDLAAAIEIVADGARAVGRTSPASVYLGRICYTDQMVAAQRMTLPYVLMDSPPRVLHSLDLSDDQVALVQAAAASHEARLLDSLVTDELLAKYQVTGTPAECADTLRIMTGKHGLDAVTADVLSTNLDENIDLLEQTFEIISHARNHVSHGEHNESDHN